MRFTLLYQGPLASNGSIVQKHQIRRHFHVQLRELWQQRPLAAIPEHKETIRRSIGAYHFVPLVNGEFKLVAALRIAMLRSGEPGSIVTRGGDIDNRLKTLLDALRAPQSVSELPPEATPAEDETPYYCLLEDDALIVELDVRVDRLLAPLLGPTHVHLWIEVQTRAVEANYVNIGLV